MADYIFVGGELYHYGVKGMKWGVRKKRTVAEQKDYIEKKRKKAEDITRKVEQARQAIKDYRANSGRARTDIRYRESDEWSNIQRSYWNATDRSKQKKLAYQYAQSKWELGKAVNDLDRMLDRHASMNISRLSPRAIKVGKTALKAMGPLMAIGGFVGLVEATGGLTETRTLTSTHSYNGKHTITSSTITKQISVGDLFKSESIADVLREHRESR